MTHQARPDLIRPELVYTYPTGTFHRDCLSGLALTNFFTRVGALMGAQAVESMSAIRVSARQLHPLVNTHLASILLHPLVIAHLVPFDSMSAIRGYAR